jgi:DNA gyrase subunit B
MDCDGLEGRLSIQSPLRARREHRGLRKEPTDRKKTGSQIRWKPDLEVFTDIAIPASYFIDIMKRQAVVNAGVTFRFRNEVQQGKFEQTDFLYETGIAGYVAELVGENALTPPVFWQAERRGRDREDKPEYKVKLSVSFCFSNSVNVIEHYHNSSWLEHGGAPEKAMRSAFISAIDARLRKNGKYQKNESKISFPDIQDCLVFVSSNFSTQTSYENQTKKAVNNRFIQEAMTDFLRSQLEVYFIENPQDADRICEQVLINKRSRETAERARLNIKKKLSGSIDITNRVQKFVDCRTRDVSRRELYIVEGDSALGACKLSRDAEFQGIMPVRGKILNCLKADFGKIFKNEIITDLLKVLGCGVEVDNRHGKDFSSFDLENLRWSRIIICTDADVDGFQIRTLILTMLYRLTPTLIREGFVYIAESPLFEITCKEKSYFAYSDREKTEILAGLGGARCEVNRSKGLGENEPEMMWLTTMNPETRRLIRVMPSDVQATAKAFDLLLGDNLTGRKEFISENGYKYLELADIS